MARRLALSSHPGPSLAVTALAVVLAVALGFDGWRCVLVALAILVGQLSIGWSNDWIDAERDRQVGRSDKPVAQGLISIGSVRAAAVVTGVATVPLSFALGVSSAIAHIVLVASGWAYNLGLKRTAFSVLPFIVSFGLLPAVVTLASPVPALAAPWAVGVGAVFGVAIHFTNVLPDLDDDRTTGVRGLPHRLGRVASGVVAFVALAIGGALVFVGPLLAGSGAPSVFSVVALVVVLGIVAVGIRLVVTRPPSRLLFQLIIIAALVIAVQLALSGTTLTV
ncbi:UbiA family prenyltransferase [Plantibacter sp. YIM 135347]|uniref:UbiA family prenyltransferase n=1 Tax=Plantibacter sp. YIM 135347 TaxID=3423919 RepID=UPI003D334B8D